MLRWAIPERAAVTPLMLAVIAVAAVVAIGVMRIGGASVASERAQAVADATALAAAVAGEPAAHAVARANDAEVVSIDSAPGSAVVGVIRAGARGTAAAEAVVPGEMDR